MVDTDPILIRIQAIDEATKVLNKVAGAVKRIKVPEMDFSGMDAPIKRISTIIPQTAKSMKKLVDPVKELQTEMNNLNITNPTKLNEHLQQASLTQKQFTSYLKKNNQELIKGVGVYDKLTGEVMSHGKAVKLAGLQASRFKFEWLSIMFAGMALDRVFSSLLSTQFQLFGVTDLLSSAWTVVLLPIMEIITPLIYALLEAFMNLPYGAKLAVGAFIIFGAIIAKILLIGGQLMLFLGGLKILFGPALWGILVKGAGTAVGAFLPIIAVIAGVGLAIAGLYLIFKGKFEGIGLIIAGVGLVLLLFIGWWALIPIAVGAAVYLIIKHWDVVKKWFSSFTGWLSNIFSNVWGGIIKGFQAVGKVFKAIWDGIKNTFKGAINFIIGGMNFWLSGIGKMINGAIKGLNKLIKLMNKIPGVNIKRLGSISMPKIPYLQEGGLIKSNGLAYLHAGERVIPKDESGGTGSVVFSPTINLNASVSSDYDVRKLADQLNKYWAADFERAIRGRSR